MAATTVFTGALAPGANSGAQVLTMTPPFLGVEISISAAFAIQVSKGTVPNLIYTTYQTSVDGGVTYSNTIPLGRTPQFSVTGSTEEISLAIDQAVTHVKFIVTNNDPNNTASTVTLKAAAF